MRIEKKTWPDMFEKVLKGIKKYDLRLADFPVSNGDILVLREWNPKTKKYTGREIEKKVTLVVKSKDLRYWKEEEINKYGFQIISFE